VGLHDRTPSPVRSRHAAYDEDFVAWTEHTAALLRARRFDEIDVEHVAEEVEDMGTRDRRELASRLTVLVTHLLKWQLQPEHRSTSWDGSIAAQQTEIGRVLRDSPSLRRWVEDDLVRDCPLARTQAAKETGLPAERFPLDSPWKAEQVLDAAFHPG
jgi:hypothetical protein